jgi:hypothetical protein
MRIARTGRFRASTFHQGLKLILRQTPPRPSHPNAGEARSETFLPCSFQAPPSRYWLNERSWERVIEIKGIAAENVFCCNGRMIMCQQRY